MPVRNVLPAAGRSARLRLALAVHLVLAGAGPALAQVPAEPAATAPGLVCVPLPPPASASAIEVPETKPCPLTTPTAQGEPCTCGPIVGKADTTPAEPPAR
ncbi:hypothetical protein [Zavarzinia sp. CC-PAN008]|uniref:hypothetical protein n=1 Tax=Zavarzinia sp. CC-PAN008 TaxID=3243332 RepID=UPI003F745875